jgi:hypothetical protein
MTRSERPPWYMMRLVMWWHICSVLWLLFSVSAVAGGGVHEWYTHAHIIWCLGNIVYLGAAAWAAERRQARISSVIYVVLILAGWYVASSSATDLLPATVRAWILTLIWYVIHVGYYVLMRRQLKLDPGPEADAESSGSTGTQCSLD